MQENTHEKKTAHDSNNSLVNINRVSGLNTFALLWLVKSQVIKSNFCFVFLEYCTLALESFIEAVKLSGKVDSRCSNVRGKKSPFSLKTLWCFILLNNKCFSCTKNLAFGSIMHFICKQQPYTIIQEGFYLVSSKKKYSRYLKDKNAKLNHFRSYLQ